jgi:hypothetical protein
MDLTELIDERDEMCLRISQLITELHEKYDNLKMDISIELKYDEYADGSLTLVNTKVKSNIII